MAKRPKNDKTNTLIFAVLGAGVGFFIADYLKEQEIKNLKAKIQSNPDKLTSILKESGGILKTIQDLFSGGTKKLT